MKKNELINNILDRNIHHNIRIDFGSMPEWDEEDVKNGFDWALIAEYMINDFIYDFEVMPENDKGNRNLCGCKNKNEKGICKNHDLYHVYTSGRMGATLYWDKYYKEGGRIKFEDYELEEMKVLELQEIKKELDLFDKKVEELMESFYVECEYRLKEIRKEAKEKERKEKEYQKLLEKVEKLDCKKRLIIDLLN
jgi:hypothetical protein